jgi:uncharacterized paraquat-inducible protein A
MHWFWRATVAVVGSLIFLTTLQFLLIRSSGIQLFASLPFGIALRLFSLLLPIALYALLTHIFPGQPQRDRETRCRRCDYILRGIPEPRCPECGEQI